jgi:hypothetical protein
MMGKLKIRHLSDITIIFNKLYATNDLKPRLKYQVIKIMEVLRKEELIFIDIKQKTVDKYVKRDKDNKPITEKVKKYGMTIDTYVFGNNTQAYNDEIMPYLEKDLILPENCREIELLEICMTNLKPSEIDTLKSLGLIKDEGEKENVRKQIIIPGQQQREFKN